MSQRLLIKLEEALNGKDFNHQVLGECFLPPPPAQGWEGGHCSFGMDLTGSVGVLVIVNTGTVFSAPYLLILTKFG